MKAVWNGQIIAESQETVIIENNHYFPRNSINEEYYSKSKGHSFCPWKGDASYFTLDVNGTKNEDAAWYYENPMEAAKEIKDYVAFWKGVEVIE